MADRDSRADGGKQIDIPVLTRLAQGAKFVFTGKFPGWFGPADPTPPIAQESAGRRFDYMFGQNLTNTPKFNEGITFEQLRSIADLYDPLRLVIETRKDQMAKQKWIIRPRKKDSKKDTTKLTELFSKPDGINDWSDWLRLLIEDLLVIDAPTIYPRKTLGGTLFSFDPVDGATIKVIVDQNGRRPTPPLPAYQQNLKGMAASEYTATELVYKPRNIRTNKIYGFSPVEQVVNTVQIGLRRQLSQLQYFTEGTLPDAFAGVPEEWTIDQIKEWQDHWDTKLNGGSGAQKRKLRFMAKAMAESYKETKAPPLKDQFDEWVMRIIAFAFSIDVTPFIAQVNRSVAETNREQSLVEGLVPLKLWVKSLVDTLLRDYCGAGDCEFEWEEEVTIKPVDQANIHATYLNAGAITVNEVRADIGREPFAEDDGNTEERQELTGIQITSMREIIMSIGTDIPPETGKTMLRISFPLISEQLINELVDPLATFTKPEPLALPVGSASGASTPPSAEGTDDEGAPVGEGTEDKKSKKDDSKKVEVHVHMPEQRQPDVYVEIGATTVNATMASPVPESVVKTVHAVRNPDGTLTGTITETTDTSVVHKSLSAPRSINVEDSDHEQG